jgi:hypothetical protein
MTSQNVIRKARLGTLCVSDTPIYVKFVYICSSCTFLPTAQSRQVKKNNRQHGSHSEHHTPNSFPLPGSAICLRYITITNPASSTSQSCAPKDRRHWRRSDGCIRRIAHCRPWLRLPHLRSWTKRASWRHMEQGEQYIWPPDSFQYAIIRVNVRHKLTAYATVMYRFHPAVHWKKGYPDRQQIVSSTRTRTTAGSSTTHPTDASTA